SPPPPAALVSQLGPESVTLAPATNVPLMPAPPPPPGPPPPAAAVLEPWFNLLKQLLPKQNKKIIRSLAYQRSGARPDGAGCSRNFCPLACITLSAVDSLGQPMTRNNGI